MWSHVHVDLNSIIIFSKHIILHTIRSRQIRYCKLKHFVDGLQYYGNVLKESIAVTTESAFHCMIVVTWNRIVWMHQMNSTVVSICLCLMCVIWVGGDPPIPPHTQSHIYNFLTMYCTSRIICRVQISWNTFIH